MDIFNNAWVVGIGGGVISGLIVFFVTSKIFSRREKREYLQRLMTANNEILYAVRPIIVEQKLPTEEIVNSLLHSTAKKYNVKFEELFNHKEIADDLTKEIMDNPFLTSENKLKYCEITNSLRQLGIKKKLEEKATEVQYIEKEKGFSSEFFSTTLALMTTLMVVMTVFIFYIMKDKLGRKGDVTFDLTRLVPIITGITIIPILALLFSKFLQMIRRIEKVKEQIKKDILGDKNRDTRADENVTK